MVCVGHVELPCAQVPPADVHKKTMRDNDWHMRVDVVTVGSNHAEIC